MNPVDDRERETGFSETSTVETWVRGFEGLGKPTGNKPADIRSDLVVENEVVNGSGNELIVFASHHGWFLSGNGIVGGGLVAADAITK